MGAARVGAAYVRGYIVGTNNNIDQFAAENLHLEDGFKATNLVLAGKPDVTAEDIASMIPVALPKGELRDAFSLTKHADYKGKEIVV